MIAKRSGGGSAVAAAGGPHISGMLDGGGLQKYYCSVNLWNEHAKMGLARPWYITNYPWGQLVIEL